MSCIAYEENVLSELRKVSVLIFLLLQSGKPTSLTHIYKAVKVWCLVYGCSLTQLRSYS